MHSINRRNFIKSVSLAGATLALSAEGGSQGLAGDRNQIKNRYFKISFNKKEGTFAVYRHDGSSLVSNSVIRVNTGDAKRSTTSDFKHSIKTKQFTDRIGAGTRLMVVSRDFQELILIETDISLYDNLRAISIEARCKNVSPQDLAIKSIEAVRLIGQEGGILRVPGVTKCITNGQMYFDDGRIHEFGSKEGSIASGRLKGITLSNGPIPGDSETIHSWWNASFFSAYDKEGLALGFLENQSGYGNLLMSKHANDTISLVAESVYAPQVILKPNAGMSSGRFMVTLADNPYSALEAYAEAVGKLNKGRTGSIVNGWCSWFYTLSHVSESEVLANTEFAAKHLKPFGLEYIQIDEGFQKLHGDWQGNERFPHGMKWLAEKIKSAGFKPGIWISPYVISGPTEVFQKHKDWLLKNPDGSLQRVGNWEDGTDPPADENPKRYALDITHPAAAQWLHDLINMIVNDWGYQMIKVDFVAWSILAAKRYYDPAYSSAKVYRMGMEIMRKAAGDKCHILECGPGATTVGLIDSMRSELDVNYGYADAAWNTYFVDPACSASAAGKRYYFHNRTWTNDVDHLCTHLLTNRQSEAAATIIAMSGGNMMSGDRLTQLDIYKIDILKKITPSYGQAAVPVDLFDKDIPTAFAMKIKKPFAEWTVVAFFNPSLTDPVRKSFPLERLWLNPSLQYIAFDFWDQQFMGDVATTFSVTVQPGSVKLITLHEKSEVPRFLSTDRHVLQGAIEIEDARWDANTKVFSGISTGPAGSSHNVYVYIPGDHPWTWGGYILFRDFGSYTLKMVHNNIIQAHIRFNEVKRVTWQIDTKEFFKE